MKGERSDKSSPRPTVDGGWAWMVCLGAHVCNIFTMGYFTTLGIFYIEWKEYFDLSATASSWLVGMPFLVASPLSLFSGIIATRLGIRWVSMAGSAVNGLATILGSFTTDVSQLYLCGAMSGLGMVLILPPSLTILSQYFNKRFAVVSGLYVLGVSIGQTVFPPLLRLLIENYGWRGTMLIVGALQMNGIAACALYRPLMTNADKVSTPERNVEGFDNQGVTMEIETANIETQVDIDLELDEAYQTRQSTDTDNDPLNASKITAQNEATKADTCRSLDMEGSENEGCNTDTHLEVNFKLQESSQSRQTTNPEQETQHASQDEVLFQDINSNKYKSTDCDQNSPEENNEQNMRGKFNFLNVFTNYKVMLLLLVTSFYAMAFNTNFTHLPARAKEGGLSDDQGALLLTVLAIFSMITRATHGWFVDRNYISSLTLQMIVILGAAIVAFVNPVSDSYAFLVGYSVILGGSIGIASPLILVNARSVVSPSQVPDTLSLILASAFLFNGTGSVIAGKMYDTTGNYVAPFLVAGAMFLAAFILTAIVTFCNKRRHELPKTVSEDDQGS